MTLENLQPILTAISTTSDLTTIVLNIQKLGTKISAKTLTEIQNNDNKTIEHILNDCFIRKEVLWQRIDYENNHWCFNSLVDLQKNCDHFSSTYLTLSNDNEHFYSQILRLWGNYCNEAYKDLYRNKENRNYDIGKTLKTLRKGCYKIVITFIQLLPDGNIIKKESFDKLETGCKNSKITIQQILPDWIIE